MNQLLSACFIALIASTNAPDATEIHNLIKQLGDPNFEMREAAVEALYAAGPAALEALESSLSTGDLETALRAKVLIERIQQLYLVGAEIKIIASHSQVAWDQPLAIRVEIKNPGTTPILLPFLVRQRDLIDSDPLSKQVGDMLDVVDYLTVLTPSGSYAELRIDDYRGHAGLEQAIEVRAYDEPASLLQPQQTFTLELQAFNRGFARMQMLHRGDYVLQFLYVPEWDDPELVANEVGKVSSNTLKVSVTRGAPEQIVSAKREARLELDRANDKLQLRLVNTHDRPVGINLNIGTPHGDNKFARVRFRAQTASGEKVLPFTPKVGKPFTTDLFTQLQPLESVVLAELTLSEILSHTKLKNSATVDAIEATYTNVTERSSLLFQRNETNPADPEFRKMVEKIPLPTFVGSISSPRIPISTSTAEN